MKTLLQFLLTLFLGVSILPSGIYAQDEKSEVVVKIIKDGKVIKDTTYFVEDEESANIAAKLVDITLGEKSTDQKVYAFKSKDGSRYEWASESKAKEMLDTLKHIYIGEGDPKQITVVIDEDENKAMEKKVIVVKDNDKELKEAKEIIVIKKIGEGEEEGDNPDIEWVEKGGRKILIIDENGKEETIKILGSEGESSTQTFITQDGETIIIKELKEGDNERQIEVKVITDDKNAVSQDKKNKKKKKDK